MSTPVPSEVASRADFSHIRYAQVWEDADILIDALRPAPGMRFLSIASAGDNALALLASGAEVVAVDLSPAQIACLELRVAAFRVLDHGELLELIGSTPSERRLALYGRCRAALSDSARDFWDARPDSVVGGIGAAGKFEHYFRLFRRRVIPFVHGRKTIRALLQPRAPADRLRFYEDRWNTWRWRLLFRIFFSRLVMAKLGRDPAFFRYVKGSVAERILARTRYALSELDPAANPYLRWILTESHAPDALPCYLRPENHQAIQLNINNLSWRQASVEEVLAEDNRGFDGFNLSDIFEYMSETSYHQLLHTLVAAARPDARLAYWNMLVPRRRPAELVSVLRDEAELSARLFARDQAFFYSAFVVETLIRPGESPIA